MSEIWTLGIVALFFLAAGFFLGSYIVKLKTQSGQSALREREQQLSHNLELLGADLQEARGQNQALQLEKERLGQELVRRESEIANLEEKHREQRQQLEELQKTFTREFENLANKILDEKSVKFTEQNQKNIKNILLPLQERIQHFEKKVEETRKENYGIHQALREQLLNLQNQNLKITQEAENLTRALKGDSKMQGNWGELVLERVLEKSGLERDREYSVQQSFTREDGTRLLPDVIINLPNGNKMVVDSKVSLTDYERYVNADEEARERHLKDHVNSLKRHVEQLSAKKYEDLYEMESPDFVLMFVPIETAFSIAINADNDLYNNAFVKNIVIVTPSTLLATLRTIDSMWSNEKQRRNAIEIARQAGALYDKFEGFVTDLTRVGKKMDDAKSEYRGAMNKLVEGRGNILTSIEKLKKMGAKAKKSIPESLLKRAREAEEDAELELEDPTEPNPQS
ncbi:MULTISPECIES: DNA recombination protein RmuC [Robiginitalea]|uniref:Probable periplasmic protein n=1 Tax=Robiginitalea biformata (strain ATCC BAA-864 / DSM 15991 / KCTC 12146 / HTCC2501) TaxID=313596 RepID=A4CNI8_ROBBH|nr:MULTISPECIES: DNA recombination protein RmuC [Robiginitalea]EAR14455.1 probable periplasmic protein [Robiginitalea biformata HTCC2501]MDC6355056.1 DNA recombination protein RmuC [Robiginitalea sp. PM2]MDC6375323.1 DNA recombination protein RmuC [Robiginitalea sp. SP8]